MSFPVVVDLRDRLCLVVGRSVEARLRVNRLLAAGALVRWVTQGERPSLETTLPPTRVTVCERAAVATDVSGCWLAVLADRDDATASLLMQACEAQQVFYCAIDQPRFNSFSHVAIVDQPPLQLALSSGGQVPALVRRLRQALERALDDGRLSAYAKRLAALRSVTPEAQRKAALEQALEGFDLELRLSIPDEGRRSEES